MSEPGTLLVLAPNWLGDAIMALPAIQDLRRHFASARLIVAARASTAPIFEIAPAVDNVIVLQWRGSLVSPDAFGRDVSLLRGHGADAVVLMPNSFGSAWLVRRAGIPQRWGYGTDGRGMLLTRSIRRPRARGHQGEYYQHLVRELGATTGALEPHLHVPDASLDSARGLLRDAGWRGDRALVTVAPGAAYGTAKRWIPEYVAALVTRLVRERHAFCALVGSAADGETTRMVRNALGPDASAHVGDLAGRTDVTTLAAVLSLSRMCLANDSGAMHLAAGLGVPVAAVFGPTNERETAPLATRTGRVELLINPVWCRPCMLRECPIDHRCMRGLRPDTVFAAAIRLMPTAGESGTGHPA